MRIVTLVILYMCISVSCSKHKGNENGSSESKVFMQSSFVEGKVNYLFNVNQKSGDVCGIISNGTQEVSGFSGNTFTIIEVATSETWELTGEWGYQYVLGEGRSVTKLKNVVTYAEGELVFKDLKHPLVKASHGKYTKNSEG